MALLRILFVSFLMLLVISCERINLQSPLKRTPHGDYSKALAEAGLDKSELGRRWLSMAESALTNSLKVQLPYGEIGWLTPQEIQAFSWQFLARKGRRLIVELKTPPENRGEIFIDLFVVEPDKNIEHVTSLDKDEWRLDHLVKKDANYLLRLQPELLAGGRYELTITLSPSLTFPVEGKGSAAIQGFFGAPRDSGRREHHGVDIFAPRGTTVVAAADGIVFQTGVTPRGGKVVWLQDRHRSQTYYYAHLNDIVVKQGERVKSGDPLGSVGNTGNARLGPPHLHFSIYEWFRGPVDPFPFIYSPDILTGRTQVAHKELESTFRVTTNRLRLRGSPNTKAPTLTELERYTIVRAIAKTGQWYRVALTNGLQGYVLAQYIHAVKGPVEKIQFSKPHLVRAEPTALGPEIGRIAAGKKVGLYGRFGDFRYVKLPSGHFGWIAFNRDRDRGLLGLWYF